MEWLGAEWQQARNLQRDSGAESLLKLAGKVDSSVMGPPSFCCVVVPGGYAYRRSDGVFVIPVTCMCA